MALALGISAGGKFYVDNVPVELVKWFDPYTDAAYPQVTHYHRAMLRVQNRQVEISDDQATMLLPDVFVSCGKVGADRIRKYLDTVKDYERRTGAGEQVESPGRLLPRLLIEAPRRIAILREELYVKGKRVDA